MGALAALESKTLAGSESAEGTNDDSIYLPGNKNKGNTDAATQEIPKEKTEFHDASNQTTVIVAANNTSTQDRCDSSHLVAAVIPASDVSESTARTSKPKE